MTDTSKKPRVFWISMCTFNDGYTEIYECRDAEFNPCPPAEKIRVIEYSAYQSLKEQCEKLVEALESLDKFAEYTRDHIFDVSECTPKGCLNGKNQSKDQHTKECRLLDKWNDLVEPHQKTLAEFRKWKEGL